MSKDEFSTIVLDGSMLHAAWSQLYSRCGQIIRSAIKRKRDGIGCFARPEADVALMGLLAVMDAVDPEAEWLETGMITYLYSIDDALQRAPEVWWGQEWLAPIEGTSKPFKDFNAAALLQPMPRSTHASRRIIAQLLIGVRELKPPVKPGCDAVARRRMLYDALLRRLGAVRGLLARPDGSFPRAKPINLDPLPPELGEPLWRNTRLAPFSPPDVAYQRRFGHVLMLGLYGALREASRAMDLLPRYLGLENLPQGYDEYRSPHLKYWLDVTPFPNLVGLLEAAILDRNLGAPPEELLSACMAAGRYMSCATRWSLPFAPKWLHVEQWDAALLSCMTNDQASLSAWLENYPAAARHYPPGTRTCGRILEHWIRDRQWPENLKLPKSLDQFELGFATAMKGLVARDENLCSQGVVQMLRAFGRIDYRMVRGRWFFDLCLQVVAVQRMARREGLKLNVPDDRPNDIQLVVADDPLTPLMPWCPLPGIELVAQSQDTIAWPSLYLNQAVIDVCEPLTEH